MKKILQESVTTGLSYFDKQSKSRKSVKLGFILEHIITSNEVLIITQFTLIP